MAVVAINQASAERVKEIQEQVIKDEMRDFIKNDPEARAMMISRVREIISGLSNWDIEYHSNFKDVTAELLLTDDLKPLLSDVIKRVLTAEKSPDYRIIEAIAEYLANKIEMKVSV